MEYNSFGFHRYQYVGAGWTAGQQLDANGNIVGTSIAPDFTKKPDNPTDAAARVHDWYYGAADIATLNGDINSANAIIRAADLTLADAAAKRWAELRDNPETFINPVLHDEYVVAGDVALAMYAKYSIDAIPAANWNPSEAASWIPALPALSGIDLSNSVGVMNLSNPSLGISITTYPDGSYSRTMPGPSGVGFRVDTGTLEKTVDGSTVFNTREISIDPQGNIISEIAGTRVSVDGPYVSLEKITYTQDANGNPVIQHQDLLNGTGALPDISVENPALTPDPVLDLNSLDKVLEAPIRLAAADGFSWGLTGPKLQLGDGFYLNISADPNTGLTTASSTDSTNPAFTTGTPGNLIHNTDNSTTLPISYANGVTMFATISAAGDPTAYTASTTVTNGNTTTTTVTTVWTDGSGNPITSGDGSPITGAAISTTTVTQNANGTTTTTTNGVSVTTDSAGNPASPTGDPTAPPTGDPTAPTQTLGPIIIDMDGNGVDIIARDASKVYFDYTGNGFGQHTAWAGAHDAFVVEDLNGDGQITDSELAFANRTAAIDTDLQALMTLHDTNGDGQITTADTGQDKLRLWVDANSNGVADAGELQTFAQAGLTTLSGQRRLVNYVGGDAAVSAMATATFTINGPNGVQTVARNMADVAFTMGAQGFKVVTTNADGSNVVATQDGRNYVQAGAISGLNLILAGTFNGAQGNAQSDHVQATVAAWVDGGAGNDALIGSTQNDWLRGGVGKDMLDGGDGNDVLVIDAQDDARFIQGGKGFDTAIVEGATGVTLDLAASTLEAAYGGDGNDVFTTSGTGSVVMNGGAGNDSLTGSTSNDFMDGGAGADYLAGGNGNDTYFVDNTNDVITEGILEGTDLVNASVSYTLASNVENLTLTGNFNINATGNAGINVLTGNSGNNILDGGLNYSWYGDTLYGGLGNDTYIVRNRGDGIIEHANEGIDTIVTSLNNYHLNVNIENLTLSGTESIAGWGNSLDNIIIGNDGANNLSGEGGNDWLFGGAGNDLLAGNTSGFGITTMQGGIGDDVYFIYDASDVVIENTNEGIDTINYDLIVSFTLAEDFENLNIFRANVTGTGNSKNNVLSAFSSGATLIGALGDDTYQVYANGTTIREFSGEGIDNVISYVSSYSLEANVENLTLFENINDWAPVNLVGLGNELNNTITGNHGDNLLDGGAGADMLIGGRGNDTYEVDSTGDVIMENVDEGYDLVNASINYTLGNNLENLTLTGTSDINGTGNELDNFITGNSGNNVLDGGNGYDILVGGIGNDTYVISDAGAAVMENLNEGVDQVNASISFRLGDNIENLTLTGATMINGTGNALANTILGNSADNILDGAGGADVLIGGLGNDAYVVDNTGDLVSENTNEGIDVVYAGVSYSLGANLENLFQLGTSSIDATGNALDNFIVGNYGDNVLDGGAGADTLVGGTGNDTYIVDNIGDVVVERQANDPRLITVTSNGSGADGNVGWRPDSSADARFVVFDSSGDNLVAADTNNASDVFIKDLLTGAIQRVSTDANGVEGNGRSRDGHMSADGRYVVFYSDSSNLVSGSSGTLFVKDLLTGVVRNVETSATGVLGDGYVDYASISSDGRYVAFSSTSSNLVAGDTNGVEDVFLKDMQTGVIRRMSADALGKEALTDSGSSRPLTISQDGRYVIFESLANLTGADLNGVADVYRKDWQSGAIELVSVARYGRAGNADSGTEYSVSASADGRYIAFESYATDLVNGGTNVGPYGQMCGIYIRDMRLGTTQCVSTNVNGVFSNSDSWAPTLSADGRYLVFKSGATNLQTEVATDGGANIYIKDLQSGAVKCVSVDTNGVASGNCAGIPKISSDSRFITFASGTSLAAANLSGMYDTYQAINPFLPDNPLMPAGGIDTVKASVSYSLSANVENLTLSGVNAINGTGNVSDNVLIGNVAANTLSGGVGNDTLDGGLGADVLIGGLGNDTYVVDNAGDVITENFNEGTDLVNTSVSYTLSANVENLTLTGTAAINGTGNALDNVITGNSASNVLDGGAGADTLVGGLGNDTYVADNAGDVITENLNEGTDLVNASVSYTLGANVENLTLTGTSAINGTGNALANVLTGNAAANMLDGGAGADTMVGGAGNDTYYVDNASDVTIEAAGAGIDLVVTNLNWVLATDLENLTLTGTVAINGTGNALANVITGNSADNILDGGTGSDTLIGGLGNDTYVLDVATDSVTENLNEGIDTVKIGLTYTLGVNVENLILTGTTAINGTGNALSNVLTGNVAANVLDGGAGADTLIGGLGNDTYVVDNAGDAVTENLNEGTDSINASVSYTLSANLENLTLTGTTAINGTGNSLVNVLTGNSAANVLDGGAGADTMVGGAGNDTYYVDNAADVTTEAAAAGTDTVMSTITWTLGTNLENLTLLGTAAINATGNTVANVLTGNAGDNVLNGGAGADTMIGGLGNDTYILDVATDIVTENLNEGIDTVQIGVTYTLGANVENLTLTGTTAINGTGNALDNVLTGNSGKNILTGGAGNDTYVVGTGDTTIEAANGGIDTVQSAITWTLATELENLTLTGTTAVNGTGNAADNVLLGNSAANTLTGNAGNDTLNGGAGADSLVGGAGNDTYWLGRGYGVDTITENDATVGNTDVARFDTGIAVDQLWFTHTGNNLDVSIIGTTDKFTLTNWYLGNQYHVEQFKTSDGKTLLDSQVQNLVNAMAAFAPPAAGQTTLPANYATSLQPVIAANWQ